MRNLIFSGGELKFYFQRSRCTFWIQAAFNPPIRNVVETLFLVMKLSIYSGKLENLEKNLKYPVGYKLHRTLSYLCVKFNNRNPLEKRKKG